MGPYYIFIRDPVSAEGLPFFTNEDIMTTFSLVQLRVSGSRELVGDRTYRLKLGLKKAAPTVIQYFSIIHEWYEC
ncbi:hypothetical protein V3C99_006073 [Haemonchus contortus]